MKFNLMNYVLFFITFFTSFFQFDGAIPNTSFILEQSKTENLGLTANVG